MRAGVVDENRSIWALDGGPPGASPALAGTIAADVAIVGGGLTGISTAWHLARRLPERRVVLLEARAIGNGASGRNGGQVLNGVNGVPSTDPELTPRIFGLTQQGIALIEEVARDHAPDAGFARDGCLEVCTTPASAERAHAEVERLRGLGLPVRWLARDELRMPGTHGAILDPTAGRVDTLALLRGWRRAVEALGVTICERSPVVRVVEGRPLRVVTERGEVRAERVVLATGAYTPALGWFRESILTLHAHALATPVLSDEVWSATGLGSYDGFSDDLDRIAYACRTASGRLVFGGGSNAAYAYRFGGACTFTATPLRQARTLAALRATLARYFPALADVEPAACWTGLLDLTFDRAPSIGVTGEGRNVYYALGYSGHGIVLGVVAGRVIADLIAGDDESWRTLPFVQRSMPRIPPEPLRWVGYQAYTRLTGKSPRRG